MNTERIAAIFSIVLAGSTYYMATGYSNLSSFFPKVISILIIILSTMLLIKSFRKPEASEWHKEIEYKYLIMLIVGIVVYVIVIPVVGFVSTSIVFISLYSWLLSHNKTQKLPP
ncbi:MAG: hypothetical protein JM58_13520 [Peptococcaceae bacterium BICA1-8]|nr:MAG: hypothetical protein JM58_13520 [Peptococcaceae bacterium BICA1-8]